MNARERHESGECWWGCIYCAWEEEPPTVEDQIAEGREELDAYIASRAEELGANSKGEL